MTDQTIQRKPDITTLPELGLAQSKGELIVMAPPAPPLADLTAAIRRDHSEVVGAAVDAVMRAIRIGKALLAAKKEVGHGNFENYVALECRFAMRCAQNYMKLARNEAKINQDLGGKSARHAYMTMGGALKWIDKLSDKGKRRKRAKPKQT